MNLNERLTEIKIYCFFFSFYFHQTFRFGTFYLLVPKRKKSDLPGQIFPFILVYSVFLQSPYCTNMNLEKRIEAFSFLGNILRDSLDYEHNQFSGKLNRLIESQRQKNTWFTPDNVRTALRAIADELTSENLRRWTSAYRGLQENFMPVRVGLIFAGNIPLAGFHDFLTVLISGNKVVAKTSSKDPDLIPFLSEIICTGYPEFVKYIEFTEGTLSGFDMVIATGSNNSSRYFDYYFRKYPKIIRKNRNSIAILTGDENSSELENLGKDIFTYFGLGCRNVSKVYLPKGYDPAGT